ncbi:hypothetical protein J3R83DRAFT_7164 [Lanmaoa asiatica]|nr:hypothetical protein J3R83DRAFT_7164 [Lanmaoa asiatica]
MSYDGDIAPAWSAGEESVDARHIKAKVVSSAEALLPLTGRENPQKSRSLIGCTAEGRNRPVHPSHPNMVSSCALAPKLQRYISVFFFLLLSLRGIPALVSKVPARSAEQPKVGPSGGMCMWEKRAERAATTRRSFNSAGSQSMTVPAIPMTGTPGAAASAITPIPSAPASVITAVTPPKRVLVDKCVATESRPIEKLGHQEAEFIKGLVSLILEVIQTHQSGSLIPRTVSANANVPGSGSPTGLERDQKRWSK